MRNTDHAPLVQHQMDDKIARLSPQQKEIFLSMLASTSLDDARRTHYDRPSWHYIDYPSAPPGQGGIPQQPPVPHAETRIDSLVRALKTAPENAVKAISVRWLLHLAEKIHQPLHATCLYTSTSRMAITAAII